MTNPSFPAKDAPRSLQTWVTKDTQNPVMGILPAATYVIQAHVHVTEAFNSDGTDLLTVGWDTDADAIVTSIDVSTTGVKSVTLGSNAGYNGTAQKVKAYYVNGGSEPTTGKAFVLIETVRVPVQP